MKKLAFVLLSMLSMSVYAYSQTIAADLENSLIRLHILADSNSEADQNIKLAIRNEVLDAVRDINVKDTELFRAAAENSANSYLEENNIPYRAKAVYGKFEFPKKTYKNITLPQGEYYGIRIILGSGSGENWWCIMYPPLCVSDNNETYIDKDADKMLRDELTPETYELITGNNTTVKFRVLEWLQNIT